jgi:hypothetical protein
MQKRLKKVEFVAVWVGAGEQEEKNLNKTTKAKKKREENFIIYLDH